MNAQRTSSFLLISLMLISLHSPLIQAEWGSEEEAEESDSLFPRHTPIIDSLSENLQWSFARLQAPLEGNGYSEVPREWVIVTDQITKISEQMKHGKMVQDRFLDHVYTVPGSSITLETLDFLQETGQIELFAPNQDSLQPTPMTIPDDPLIADQWHLINTGQDGNSVGVDLNVTAAWDRYNGSGVMIRIVDDGLDILHEDLQPNFDASTSYDYCDNDEDPSPVASSDNHGTAVAGVAAGMGDNGIGIAGVAWGASHNHARFLCGGAAVPALSDFNQDIDIYHNSWGYGGAGFASLGPSSAAMLESGVYDGRSSLGSIFTFSAGNEYTSDENVNQKGFQKSRYTIAIGAITYSGVQSWYSSIGAPVLVVGPSNGGSLGITTADRTGSEGYSSTNYTDSFGGTSSSGPKVAGVAGLILEAEPTLTWRDMQAILVHSSTPNDLNHENWSVNGAGLPVSHYYGFGMVDATAAVNLAENWTLLGPEANISTPLYTPSVNIPSSGTPLSFSHTVTDLLNIESVELFMDVDHQNPEDLIITLTSPSGYTSILADTNPAEYGNMRYHDMVSMHHYGELTAGTWTVNVLDVNSTGSTGTVNDWQLVFHGTEADADGDGWTNEEENLCGSMVNDPNSTPDDVDGDGTCDAMDEDIDGDGWPNVSELACGTDAYDPLSLPSADTDSDGLCDSVDIDDDNDGVEDNMDAFPLDGQAWQDTDGDGLADETYKLVCCTYSLDEFEDVQLNTTFSWDLGSPPSWSLDNSTSSSGNVSLRSGVVSDNQASSISLTLFTESANGSFAYKVDSESGYDFLIFSVDGAQVESWSGDTGWSNYSFLLSAGTHTLQWTYSKDYTVSNGQDAAWIDNLDLPTGLFMTNPEVTDYGTQRDHDDDGDGVDDISDAFPLDGSETADFDGDGIGDNADLDDDGDGWFDIMETQCGFDPLNSTSMPSDNDGDGLCDSIDPDDDNDGYADQIDEFPLDAGEWVDTDLDGIGDNADEDDDDDGVTDEDDAFPTNNAEWNDLDGDGLGSNADTDDDGDGVLDENDVFPMNATEWADFDGDGIGDNADTDDDDDGVLDEDDAFPQDSTETLDTDADGLGNNADTDDDGDGVLDESDAFPLNATEWADFDDDGIGDNADTDDDSDGVLDEEDAFPLDSTETLDTDSDGLGNNADTDDDSDGVLDEEDAFPLDSTETLDTDSDGLGNNADTDDDSDGVLDEDDAFPLSPAESVDTDGDGLGNNADMDDDSDGVLDEMDAFPLNATEQYDFDGDGIGDNSDNDDDADEVLDEDDVFPLNISEWADFDDDGVGDNTDTDDDGDGVEDTADSCPDTLVTMSQTDTAGCSAEQRDTDDDGSNDFLDDDDDGDGWTDLDESVCGTDPLLISDKPIDSDADLICDILDEDDDNDGISDLLDSFPLDPFESVDTDGDSIGDNSDTDDDNDGVLDANDAYPLDGTRTYDERVLIGAAAIGAALIASLGVASVLGVKKRKIKPDNDDIQMMLQALEK
ncbi:MAG: S8 family serine peptidase [Candidatus Thalassarchaeaceae archaeon]